MPSGEKAFNRSDVSEIGNHVINFDLDATLKLIRAAIATNISAQIILHEIVEGLKTVGEKYERKEFFLTELFAAGEIVKEAMKILRPILKAEKVKNAGRIMIFTVAGDLHDFGKNIVAALLTSAGFEVYDIGVDVPESKVIEKVRDLNPDIVGMSCLLTTSMPEMKKAIKSLQEAGLRNKVKVVVGGAAVTEEFAKEIGADAYAKDAFIGCKICSKLMKSKG